jgi:hypothetical protein|tara:strand:+ start:256 stop:699 length:444 start_codon:yes stop_codon:yes gene_type:complete
MSIGKKMTENIIVKKGFIALGIVVLIVILYPYFQPDIPESQPEAPLFSEAQESVPAPIPQPIQQIQPSDEFIQRAEKLEEVSLPMCDEFPEVADEISCEEAVIIAIKEYPGKLNKVSKADAWLIEIELEHETLVVEIDKISGKIYKK